MTRTLSQIAAELHLDWEGEDVDIRRPSLLTDAGPGSLALATTPQYAEQAEARGASALLAPPEVATGLPVIRSTRPRIDFAYLLGLFDPRPRPVPGIHPTSIISESASIDATVSVGPHVIIEDGASVGPRVVLSANAFVGFNSRIGADCVLGPNVVIYHDVALGERVRIQAGTVIGSEGYGYEWDGMRHVPVTHVGTVIIEDDVDFGANACVDRAKTGETRIGRGTKIDNLVHLAHGIIVGENCLIVAQVGTAGSVVIESGAVLGGQVGIADNVTIGPGAMVAGQTGVTGSIAGGRAYMGFPVRPAEEARRIYAAESRLPDLLRRVRELEKRLSTEPD